VIPIVVVDHGAGNLVSIAQALAAGGASVKVSDHPGDLRAAAGVVLPGVGSTGAVMAGIDAAGLRRPLMEAEVPLLGICVGMQVLFSHSEEDGTACLGVIPGEVRRLRETPRLPHIGWNDVDGSHRLFAGTDQVFYFVHSYAPQPDDPSVVIGTTGYHRRFVSAVASGNRYGVQFHPERSGPDGLRVLANFVACCSEAADAA
jgi:glutamine amidotransferase